MLYGSQILFNIKKLENSEHRKLTSKLRISERWVADLMMENEYNINWIFRVLSSSQFTMQDKILDIIEENQVPESIGIDFENFSSEVLSNSMNYQILSGKGVKYEETIQLYQDSSKRYLAFYPRNADDIEKAFSNKFWGDEWYFLGFSEYPGYNTHFKFETVINYQSEIDGYIKRDHFVYLTILDLNNKTHYLHWIKNEWSFTETHRIPITFTVIRDNTTLNSKMDVSRSKAFLLSSAHNNFYLNVHHEINKTTGEYVQKDINFSNWDDPNSIDFNSWWQIEVIGDGSKALIRNFNNGKYLIYTQNDKSKMLDFTQNKDKATQFEFTSVSSDLKDINEYTEDEVFKIKIADNFNSSQNYLWIEEGNFNNFFDDKELNSDCKKWVIQVPAEDNTYDCFKLVMPREEIYLELSIWIDSREYIHLFIEKLENSHDFLSTLVQIKDGLSRVLIKNFLFIKNQLKGRTRSDYTIGQIIPHRQEMIFKVGILYQLTKLLELIFKNVINKHK